MKQVLFVDDEPNILEGLRRMLRALRRDFNFHFAANGREALALMQQVEIDVIVSDMRMPGMDGATLLEEVRRLHPHAIRIILSGHADEQAILRTVGVVHRYLSKPSGPEQLKAVLENAAAIHTMLSDGTLKNLVSEIGALPCLPSVFTKLQQMLASDTTSVDEVGALIEQDIALSAKVLQLVNSAFFGLPQQVESPARAVTLLGLDTIRALALGVGIFSDLPPGLGGIIESLWDHSLRTSELARRIARHEAPDDKPLAGHAFIAGLLHDLGKLILATRLPAKYREASALAAADNIPLHEAEQRVFGVGHCPVGAYLLGLWGLPGCEVEAVAFHHQLQLYPETGINLARIVAAADAMAHEMEAQEGVDGLAPPGSVEEVVPDLKERVARWRDYAPL
ncbi:MAG: hypothetical protein BWK76_07265 [Desulfobulbaceae bacterium A2]|uniref:Two-component system response regulator n=1 Tax=Rhodoferax ferrireducens TaxID=192843 RepID=A0A1W9KQ22_9BURK|nr:MAG: hypothetical protein BWK72_19675 [Rhodoferax ferrireducens]OQX18509.1 MAG: hypothetical protein BWK76_07265 [Desulfobulbaceae bacterium A2]